MTIMLQKTAAVACLFLVLFPFCLAFHIPSVFATQGSWVTKTPMKQARDELGVAVVDGKIYAIGGYNRGVSGGYRFLGTNEEYDPATFTWTYKTPMPTSRSRFGIAVVDNKVYCIGGLTDNNETAVNEVYDPPTDTWKTNTPLPSPRAGMTANAVNGKIFVISGGVYNATGTTYVYDPEVDSWSTKTPIPTAVSSYASATLDNKIYIIGGFNLGAGDSYSLTQIYDTKTDNWTLGAPLQYRTYYAAAGATTGTKSPKRIYVLGGTAASTSRGINQIYDPETNNWTLGAPMQRSRMLLAVAVVDDTIYALGGDGWPATGPTACCNINEQYIPIDYVPEFLSWTQTAIAMIAVVTILVIYKRNLAKPINKVLN